MPASPTAALPTAINLPTVDILAIAAHRDDVEQTCGGTMLKMASLGWRTGILDLTQGESGTRGSAAERAAEADAAARLLNASWREALDLPDGRVENTWENRLKIAAVLRRLRPRVVILPYWEGRHPDHYTCATLGFVACFVSGLARVSTPDADARPEQFTAPHRPFKILYASLYADVRPTFVVDITPFIEQRHAALMAYRSQYSDQDAGTGLFIPEDGVRELNFAMARTYGLMAGVRYAEPFIQKEISLAEDLMTLPVQSI